MSRSAARAAEGERDAALRAQLGRLLAWEDAHVGFRNATRGIPPRVRSARPPGFAHSAWQLVEHIRLAQADILEFCVRPAYREKRWPADYWPPTPAPRGAGQWMRSIRACLADRGALQRLAADRRVDLFAQVPQGTGQTYLRELLLVADHTAYHVGQLVALRRALGTWR